MRDEMRDDLFLSLLRKQVHTTAVALLTRPV